MTDPSGLSADQLAEKVRMGVYGYVHPTEAKAGRYPALDAIDELARRASERDQAVANFETQAEIYYKVEAERDQAAQRAVQNAGLAATMSERAQTAEAERDQAVRERDEALMKLAVRDALIEELKRERNYLARYPKEDK